MRTRALLSVGAGLALLFVMSAQAAEESEAALMKEAKIDRSHAEAIAKGSARGGTVKESELEREHGRLVWSFDFKMPGTTDVTEVQVDAKTGKVVAVEKETAAHEAAEAKDEKSERH